jgi:three-Cys-motif partner protein
MSTFFNEQKEQSLVKSTIVSKYFDVWSKVIISTQKRYPNNSQKIAYIDLFAGPGRYKDGTVSTPHMILSKAVEDDDLKNRLVTVFNDKDDANVKELENTINDIDGVKNLIHKPEVWNQEVGDKIVSKFENINLVPTLFFVDPWGYKGLSLRLVNSVLKDWGCDAIFFFNYNRINMGVNNDKVADHMNALFGENKCDDLREKIKNKGKNERELIIIEELCQALKQYGSRYVLPFRFKDSKGIKTSHHLIFVSKNPKGYQIMKDIMARESTNSNQGVPSFAYDPAYFLPEQTLLFQLSRPLDDLKEKLLIKFKGRKLTMLQVYEEDNIDTPYIQKNYKDALSWLYENKLINAISKAGKPPRSGTFGDEIIITFN